MIKYINNKSVSLQTAQHDNHLPEPTISSFLQWQQTKNTTNKAKLKSNVCQISRFQLMISFKSSANQHQRLISCWFTDQRLSHLSRNIYICEHSPGDHVFETAVQLRCRSNFAATLIHSSQSQTESRQSPVKFKNISSLNTVFAFMYLTRLECVFGRCRRKWDTNESSLL